MNVLPFCHSFSERKIYNPFKVDSIERKGNNRMDLIWWTLTAIRRISAVTYGLIVLAFSFWRAIYWARPAPVLDGARRITNEKLSRILSESVELLRRRRMLVAFEAVNFWCDKRYVLHHLKNWILWPTFVRDFDVLAIINGTNISLTSRHTPKRPNY